MNGNEIILPEERLQAIPGLWHVGARPGIDGIQALFRFENGYGASVVRGPGTYGVELAAIIFEEDAPDVYDSDAEIFRFYDLDGEDDSVFGYLSEERLIELLNQIRALPPARGVVLEESVPPKEVEQS